MTRAYRRSKNALNCNSPSGISIGSISRAMRRVCGSSGRSDGSDASFAARSSQYTPANCTTPATITEADRTNNPCQSLPSPPRCTTAAAAMRATFKITGAKAG